MFNLKLKKICVQKSPLQLSVSKQTQNSGSTMLE